MTKSLRIFLYLTGSFLSIVIFSTFGYYFIEGWTFEESFYMTVITITTVGFGEVRELSSAGRLFTVTIVLLGFGFIGFWGSQFARNLIEGEFIRVLGRRTMKNKISKLRGHFIVCGHGRIGSTICSDLAKQDIPVVAIEKDEAVAKLLEAKGFYVVLGNATSDEALREAGIEKAAGIISVVSKDSDNLFIALSARELNPRAFIIARGEDPDVDVRMLRAGADVVVSPYQLGGQQIANLVANHVGSKSGSSSGDSVTGVRGFSLKVYGIRGLHDKRQRHRMVEGDVNNIGEAVTKTNAILAVAVKRENGDIETLPKDDFTVGPEDSIVLLFRDKEIF